MCKESEDDEFVNLLLILQKYEEYEEFKLQLWIY